MKINWWKAWLIQLLVMLTACLLGELSYYLSGFLHSLLLWIALPLLGAYTACRCVLWGLNNYAAWIFPPLAMIGASFILWGYAPHAGPVLVCALISMTGAAAGQVLSERKH